MGRIGKACLHLIYSVLFADFGGCDQSWGDSSLAVLEGHTQCITRECASKQETPVPDKQC